MAEEHANKVSGFDEQGAVESKDRGMFDFLGKKEEQKAEPQHEAVATEFEKVKIEETKTGEEHKESEKKPSLLEKLHRSDSSSSSSSDEEESDSGEKKKKKKKKKKGLKEKIKEKIGGEKKEDNTAVPVEKCDSETPEKGFMEKIKEKLPVQHKKDEEATAPPPAEKVTVVHHEEESKENKGILEKIKEKIPGYHSKTEDDKDKEKETTASH
ncbi:lysine-specific histone demethylase 1-like protein 1-like [Hibiscus syriacus]|uniref:Lysine-specific histone demethylase 1-like protein 1-like n=1 Tax=Hibiscus syriacus TaxID=106335 RepID=A0A6A2ZE53_HIBSY|nr:phosphoprotein ECPP44-like [Hibiscus syriacus]KAE8690321.1 lysine-specific histone demethylase 1-like protein 1-like [Hibiscus syriacus]